MSLEVSYGVNTLPDAPFSGRTVGSIRAALKVPFLIPDNSRPLLDGKDIAEDSVVTDGILEFTMPQGTKGCPNYDLGIPCPHADLPAWKKWRSENGLSTDWPPMAESVLDDRDDPHFRSEFYYRTVVLPLHEEDDSPCT